MAASSPKIAFLHSHDYSHELLQFQLGLVPAHRLFGAAHCQEFGFEPVHLRWPDAWPAALRNPHVWQFLQAGLLWRSRGDVAAVVCTTETPAPAVLALKVLRVLRLPVIVLTVAALRAENTRGGRAVIMGLLLRKADRVYAYASAQVPLLVRRFGLSPERVFFLPFGVDVQFFAPLEDASAASPLSPEDAPDVLSVGSNTGKDYETLLDALPENMSCLIVTDEYNLAVVRAHHRGGAVEVRTAVPILQLRDLYLSARRLVVPLVEAATSSGQTVLLENLACGRAVIVSNVSGVSDYVSGTAAVPVPPGDAAALRSLLQSPSAKATEQQVTLARQRFDVRLLTAVLVEAADELRTR